MGKKDAEVVRMNVWLPITVTVEGEEPQMWEFMVTYAHVKVRRNGWSRMVELPVLPEIDARGQASNIVAMMVADERLISGTAVAVQHIVEAVSREVEADVSRRDSYRKSREGPGAAVST